RVLFRSTKQPKLTQASGAQPCLMSASLFLITVHPHPPSRLMIPLTPAREKRHDRLHPPPAGRLPRSTRAGAQSTRPPRSPLPTQTGRPQGLADKESRMMNMTPQEFRAQLSRMVDDPALGAATVAQYRMKWEAKPITTAPRKVKVVAEPAKI